MGLYRRGKTWWLDFTIDGKQVLKSTKLTDRKLAEAYATSYKAAALEDRLNPFRKKDAVLGEVLTRYLNDHLKRKPSYEGGAYIIKGLIDFFGFNFPLSRMKTRMDEYKTFRTTGDEKVKISTLNRNLVLLKAACKKAVEWDMATSNPLAGYKLDKPNDDWFRLLEDKEFSKLMDKAPSDLAQVMHFARHTGMRQGEIRALQWSEIDLERGWATVKSSKSGEGRQVPLTDEVVKRLSAVPERQRVGYVFRHNGVALIRQGYLRHAFNKVVEDAKIKDFRFHDFRHAWASHAAMRGVDAQTIAKVLGHKSLRMVQRYTHFSQGHLKISVQLAAPNYYKITTNGVSEELQGRKENNESHRKISSKVN
jgi:integrase